MQEGFEKYLKAGKIAAEIREASKELVKPGVKILDIAEAIEKMIYDKDAIPAFPINISINDIAAHYTPQKVDETTIKESDITKIDIGICVDGYIGDTAYSVSFDKKNDKLIEASRAALDEAIKLCVPDALLSDVSAKIEETIKSFGFKPISNLTGHGLDLYDLHAEPQVPNISFKSSYRLKEDQVIAIEPFATNGAGMIKDTENIFIYRLVQIKPTRNQEARKIISFAEQRYGLPLAERWLMPIIGNNLFKTRLALRELRLQEIIYDYPVLKEVKGGMISQAEHTIIVKDPPIVTTI
ncbi:MAG TPA: type II methionyl aminopeptidase [archaeon]|nr:type II methionyl aminopeptidase [archaeon]